MPDKRLDGATTITSTLKPRIDHKAPEEVVPLLAGPLQKVLVVEHEEAHGFLVRIYGPEPCLRMEVRLSNRLGIGGDERLLGRRDGERKDGREGLLRNLVQRDQLCRVGVRASPRSAAD